MGFTLHANLSTKPFILDLSFCRVLLEDNAYYPWLILVPRRKDLRLLLDLKEEEEKPLYQELKWAQTVLMKEFEIDNVNLAAIGNKTPQLHIHVIGRFLKDPAWPNTVWDHPLKRAYEEEEKTSVIVKIRDSFKHLSRGV